MSDHLYRFRARSFELGFVFGALGAVALPGPVLITLLGALGVAESAARNLLTRSRDRGMLAAERHGRVTRYRLAGSSLARFRALAGRSDPPGWDGRFHALVYDVPERERAVRDRIRYAADAAGYGLLRPGVLIAPDDRFARLHPLLGELPAGSALFAATLVPADLADAHRMVARAWDLDALAARYRAAGASLVHAPTEPPDDWAEGLRRWFELYRSFLDFQLSDPALPAALLPAGWPRADFAVRLDRVNARWAPILQPRLRAVAAGCDPDRLSIYAAPGSPESS